MQLCIPDCSPFSYRQFLADGLKQKKQKLSQGGRLASQAYNAALQDEDCYDDRILGGGDFVEQVLAATECRAASRISLNELVIRIADHCGIPAAELSLPCRQPDVVRAKAIICYLSTRYYCFSGVTVAEHLGYSTSAVSRAASRGHLLFEEEKNLHLLRIKGDS